MIKTIQYILKHEQVSRQEIAVALGFSLPTVFQNVTELMELELVCEAGEYGSTGGRKAKVLKIKEGVHCAAGIEITREEIRLILMDLSQKVLHLEKRKLKYENTQEYYAALGTEVQEFIKKNGMASRSSSRLIGVGVSIPGTINHDLGVLVKSYSLDVQNISIRHFTKYLPYDFCCENDANCAANAVVRNSQKNVVYLLLGDTVSGSVRIGGSTYVGDNFRASEFGHAILVPGGALCRCGKRGCLDAYCSTQVLTENGRITLEAFFEALHSGSQEAQASWNQYLESLAVAVSNVRAAYDCDIILGGPPCTYLDEHFRVLEEKLRAYNTEDFDTSYLTIDPYRAGNSAVGAARFMVERYIENLQIVREK